MYKKVLVPLDGSALAECTLSHLKSLFENGYVGEATLLNIVTIGIPPGEWKSMQIGFDELREQLLLSSRKYLAELESRMSSQGIKVETESVEANRPAGVITDYAQKNGMELIIMATHGYTGFWKLALGSVAFGVLNQSHVPVLLIRPEACRL